GSSPTLKERASRYPMFPLLTNTFPAYPGQRSRPQYEAMLKQPPSRGRRLLLQQRGPDSLPGPLCHLVLSAPAWKLPSPLGKTQHPEHADRLEEKEKEHDGRNHFYHDHIQLLPAKSPATLRYLVDDCLGLYYPANQNAGSNGYNGHEEIVTDIIQHVQHLAHRMIGQRYLKEQHIIAQADHHAYHQRNGSHSQS